MPKDEDVILEKIKDLSDEEVTEKLSQVDSEYDNGLEETPLAISEEDAEEFINSFNDNVGSYTEALEGSPFDITQWGHIISKYASSLPAKDRHQMVNVLDNPLRTMDSILNNKSLTLTDGAVIAMREAYPSYMAKLNTVIGQEPEKYEHEKYKKLKKLFGK